MASASSGSSLAVLAGTLVLSSVLRATALNMSRTNCESTENFTMNSTYHSNLRSLLDILSSNATRNAAGFFNVTTGEVPDKVYGYFLCRGDVVVEDCATCVNQTAGRALRDCRTAKEAVFWESICSVRYRELNFFSQTATVPDYYDFTKDNVTDQESFSRQVEAPLQRAAAKAANSTKKYATIKVEIANGSTVHSLLQCTQDLSSYQCGECLGEAVARMINSWGGRAAAFLFYPTCSARYEMNEFYRYDAAADADASAPANSPPPPNSPSAGSGGSKSRTIIVTIVPIVVFIAIVAFTCTLLRRGRQKPKKQEIKVRKEIESAESLQFEFSIIREATDDFSKDNKLGEGGFGVVYKGKLPDGQEIAVKRLSKNSNQGQKEFENEVLLMAKLQHRNLVRLLGFSTQDEERLLVYEFVPQSSLDKYLFDPTKSLLLDWDKRYQIIAGIAKGILYLHEDSQLRIVHRDLKASNILLGIEMNPKISDFGMAMLFPVDITQANASRIVGTLGYMAPEYVQGSHVSVKIDVYSFGVLVLEIISGQKISNFSGEGKEFVSLLSYAWDNWRKGTAQNLVDPNLRGALESEVMRCIHLALLCVQENPAHRPSMAMVVLMISSSSISMAVPSKPAFLLHSLMTSEISSSARYGAHMTTSAQFENKNISNNEASLSELGPR